MPINMNAGYGKLIAHALASRFPVSGKLYLVATSSLAGWEEISELFPVGPEGRTRVYNTLREVLDSGYIDDGGDDLVLVLPGHTETVNSAGQLDTGASAEGLKIVGLGSGDDRPLFTFQSAAGADFDIGSNGVVLENLRFDLTGVDALTGPLDVNDSGCVIRKCEFIVADSGGQAVVAIVGDANADGLIVEDCEFIGSENAGTTSAIRLVGGDDIKIRRNWFKGHYKITAGAIEVTTTAAGHLLIEGNVIKNTTPLSTRAINLVTGSHADIVNNRLHILSNTSPVSINESSTSGIAGFVHVSGNYYQNGTTIAAAVLL